MVKRVRVVDAIEAEAGIAYEDTPLARRAIVARRRLAALLALGALVAALEAAASARWLWIVPALALAASAWGVRAGRLGGVLGAGFAAVVAVGTALWALLASDPSTADLVAWLVALALGGGALPDIVTLLRDAELQHAYGRWARRDA